MSIRVADDVCALPLVRRLAAVLDRDPSTFADGDPLPHGWHVLMFNIPTLQSQLRADGAADLGVTLPDIGLPRLMLGGRQNRFLRPVPIGSKVRRESRSGDVVMKSGRTGRFALVKVEHRIFVEGEAEPSVIELQDYILREASTGSPVGATAPAARAERTVATRSRTIVPDAALLFRYSALTDNPHRIHYDLPYTTEREGYPALVVNGSIPSVFLLELFRATAGREPATFASRNVAPMFCNEPLHLHALAEEDGWRLWAENARGVTTFDANAT